MSGKVTRDVRRTPIASPAWTFRLHLAQTFNRNTQAIIIADMSFAGFNTAQNLSFYAIPVAFVLASVSFLSFFFPSFLLMDISAQPRTPPVCHLAIQ